ncbi:MAG: Holliday junction resolvase RuvX [Bacteroidales bacterium]|nr:Holliday junction resolvase RuvX [Bacteroidales bacterium]
MSRILAIDYGKKRCGIAVSDPMRIVAGGLTTVATGELMKFVKDYVQKEDVGVIVMGEPRQMDGSESETMAYIKPFLGRLRKELPDMKVEMVDERFTTKLAQRAMIDGGVSKKDRNNKNGLVDMVSATIILQTYMEMSR